jgi:hypothetical protein
MDTQALSFPVLASALEVLAANGVEVMIAGKEEYTPIPVISHTVLTFNRGRRTGLADRIVITPHPGTGQRRSHRRFESYYRKRMVRRPSFGDGRHL